MHSTSPAMAATRVPLSKFEPDSDLPYGKLSTNLDVIRGRLDRPLTLSEKVLYSHINEPETQVILINY